MKGPYKGILLAAIGVDANLQFYPIAYGIVETENVQTWKWFIVLLKEAIGEHYNGISWTVMSDRQKVILLAVFFANICCLGAVWWLLRLLFWGCFMAVRGCFMAVWGLYAGCFVAVLGAVQGLFRMLFRGCLGCCSGAV